jgi:hypothetical protein
LSPTVTPGRSLDRCSFNHWVKGAFMGPSEDMGVNQRASSAANPTDAVAASAATIGKIWRNLIRMIVDTPSNLEVWQC